MAASFLSRSRLKERKLSILKVERTTPESRRRIRSNPQIVKQSHEQDLLRCRILRSKQERSFVQYLSELQSNVDSDSFKWLLHNLQNLQLPTCPLEFIIPYKHALNTSTFNTKQKSCTHSCVISKTLENILFLHLYISLKTIPLPHSPLDRHSPPGT